MRQFKFRAWDKNIKVMRQHDDLFSVDAMGWQSPFTRLDLEIMQFTGLKDKNGREIYEGDILSFVPIEHSNFNKPYRPFAVYWNEKEARFSNWYPRDGVEVIGNVYENPELLYSEVCPK